MCRSRDLLHNVLLGLRHRMEHPAFCRLGPLHSRRNFRFLLLWLSHTRSNGTICILKSEINNSLTFNCTCRRFHTLAAFSFSTIARRYLSLCSATITLSRPSFITRKRCAIRQRRWMWPLCDQMPIRTRRVLKFVSPRSPWWIFPFGWLCGRLVSCWKTICSIYWKGISFYACRCGYLLAGSDWKSR